MIEGNQASDRPKSPGPLRTGLCCALLLLCLARHGAALENLSRGLIAMPRSNGNVFLSWRLFKEDPSDLSFHLYRSTEHSGPFTTFVGTAGPGDGCNFLDTGTANGNFYAYVVKPVTNGHEGAESNIARIDLPSPGTSETVIRFHVCDRSEMVGLHDTTGLGMKPAIADLNGDGMYDYVLRYPAIHGRDISVYWDEQMKIFALDGKAVRYGNAYPTRLWSYQMTNVHNFNANGQFTAYDLDQDGKAEVIVTATDRTFPEDYHSVPDPGGYLPNASGFNDFVRILDGETGQTITQAPWPGTDLSDLRFYIGIVYLEGGNIPYVVVGRGLYSHSTWKAYRYADGQLILAWDWTTVPGAPGYTAGNERYKGSGTHGIEIGDVDGDGRQEFLWGCTCMGVENGELTAEWYVPMPRRDDTDPSLTFVPHPELADIMNIGHVDLVDMGDIIYSDDPGSPWYGKEAFFGVEHCYILPPAQCDQCNVPGGHSSWTHYQGGYYGWNYTDSRKGVVVASGDGSTFRWAYKNGRHVDKGCAADISLSHPGWEMMFMEDDPTQYYVKSADGTTLSYRDTYGSGILNHIEWNGTPPREAWDGQIGRYIDFDTGMQFPSCTAGYVFDVVGDHREEAIANSGDGWVTLCVNSTALITNRLPTPMQEKTYRVSVTGYSFTYNPRPTPGFDEWFSSSGTNPPSHDLTNGVLRLPSSALGSIIDPLDEGENINVDVAALPAGNGRTCTGEGLWLTEPVLEAMGIHVVTFNTATTNNNGDGSVRRIEATYEGSRRVDFTVTQGIGNYEVGYNFGCYDSAGRQAVSGTDPFDALGTIPGNQGDGTGLENNMVAFDVAVSHARCCSVDSVGLVLIGRDSASALWPMFVVKHEPIEGGAESSSTMRYDSHTNGKNLFFGFQAPEGSRITQLQLNDQSQAVYVAVDDLAFHVLQTADTRPAPRVVIVR